jgi:hypothetical protein
MTKVGMVVKGSVTPSPSATHPAHLANGADPAVRTAKQSASRSDGQAGEHRERTEQSDAYAFRDIRAQEDMAFWAMWMFVAAAATFVVTSLGTWLIWRQVRLTRQAVEDTTLATKAMQTQNALTLAAQRPWIAISCRLKRLHKTTDAVSFLAVVTFENTGRMAAESSNLRASPRSVHVDNRACAAEQWGEYREAREESKSVLLPGERSSHEISIEANTTHRGVVPPGGVPGEYSLLVIAAAHYRFAGEDRWHVTERSFLVGLVDDSDIEGIEWFSPAVESREYAADELKTRQVHSGETS